MYVPVAIFGFHCCCYFYRCIITFIGAFMMQLPFVQIDANAMTPRRAYLLYQKPKTRWKRRGTFFA